MDNIAGAHDSKVRVLVCDDEPRLATLTARLLSDRGFQADTALHAREALERLAACGCYDILLLDVHLDAGGGNSLLESLSERQLKVPVLLTSGYPEEYVPPELRADPIVVGFIGKPYRFEALVDLLQEAIGDIAPALEEVHRRPSPSS